MVNFESGENIKETRTLTCICGKQNVDQFTHLASLLTKETRSRSIQQENILTDKKNEYRLAEESGKIHLEQSFLWMKNMDTKKEGEEISGSFEMC